MSNFIIQTNQLSHYFSKSKKAVDQLSIHVPQGSIYGFLGPNGAGKSTTMRLLSGVIPDESNAVKIFGKDLNQQMPEIFSRMGCLVESPALYLHLTGFENLKYITKIRHIKEEKIDMILKIVDLYEDRHMKVKKYSLGMKQRLAIAIALIGNPEILLLDEPVNGLDPKGIIEIRKLLIKINQEFGTTIFISSHLLSEIEKLCTHAGIIAKGKLRFEGTMKELSEQFDIYRVCLHLKDAETVLSKITQDYQSKLIVGESKIEVTLPNKEAIANLVKTLSQKNVDIYEVKILEGIEDWFMSITE